jgi:hypothetical protein
LPLKEGRHHWNRKNALKSVRRRIQAQKENPRAFELYVREFDKRLLVHSIAGGVIILVCGILASVCVSVLEPSSGVCVSRVRYQPE